jgi:hypothetical protein
MLKKCALLFLILLAADLFAQVADFEGRQATVISNGKIELTIALTGASLANLAIVDDPEHLSPFLNEARAARNAGGTPPADGLLGHYLSLDGFGDPSPEELSAGYPKMGEARTQVFQVLESTKKDRISSVKLSAQLPIAQESVIRTVQMVDGENVAYVETEVTNLLPIDRPVAWAEHAAIGIPFLQSGRVVIDIPASRCKVRADKESSVPSQLAPLKEFDWPKAPLRKGGSVALSEFPEGEPSLDMASCRIDPARNYGYVTAYQRDNQLFFGYLFNRQEYPWMVNWMRHTGDANAARGFILSSQPFDMSRREMVDMHELFGVPTYRWLPAKSKIRTRFLLFYTKVPSDFGVVVDVYLENGQVKIKEKGGRIMVLDASLAI